MVLTVYQDTLGIDTIGIGRNLKDRGISKEELDYMDIPSMAIVYEHGITEADARYLAMNDIKIVEEELCRVHPCRERLGRGAATDPDGHGLQYGCATPL